MEEHSKLKRYLVWSCIVGVSSTISFEMTKQRSSRILFCCFLFFHIIHSAKEWSDPIFPISSREIFVL